MSHNIKSPYFWGFFLLLCAFQRRIDNFIFSSEGRASKYSLNFPSAESWGGLRRFLQLIPYYYTKKASSIITTGSPLFGTQSHTLILYHLCFFGFQSGFHVRSLINEPPMNLVLPHSEQASPVVWLNRSREPVKWCQCPLSHIATSLYRSSGVV